MARDQLRCTTFTPCGKHFRRVPDQHHNSIALQHEQPQDSVNISLQRVSFCGRVENVGLQQNGSRLHRMVSAGDGERLSQNEVPVLGRRTDPRSISLTGADCRVHLREFWCHILDKILGPSCESNGTAIWSKHATQTPGARLARAEKWSWAMLVNGGHDVVVCKKVKCTPCSYRSRALSLDWANVRSVGAPANLCRGASNRGHPTPPFRRLASARRRDIRTKK